MISAVFGTTSMENRRVETDKLLDWAFRTFTTVNPDWHKATPAQLRVYEGDSDRGRDRAGRAASAYFTVDRGQETRSRCSEKSPKKALVAPLPRARRWVSLR